MWTGAGDEVEVGISCGGGGCCWFCAEFEAVVSSLVEGSESWGGGAMVSGSGGDDARSSLGKRRA